jgi:TPR repeat protein
MKKTGRIVITTVLLLAHPVSVFADTRDIAKLTAAAKNGDAIAQYNLGEAYLLGNGVDKDGDQAARWYRKSASQDYAPAEYRLGALYVRVEGNPQTDVLEDPLLADKWLHKAAEQGSGDAMRTLGRMYQSGAGVDKNEVQAFMWLDLAAAENDASGTELRNAMLKSMSPDKLAEARNLSDKWKRDHPKLFPQ